jgi:hypothetical protein
MSSSLWLQVELSEKCNISLEEDTLELLRGLNQGRRRAMKVNHAVARLD